MIITVIYRQHKKNSFGVLSSARTAVQSNNTKACHFLLKFFWRTLIIVLRNVFMNLEWIFLRRFSWIWPLLFSIFIWESAKSLGFRKVALPESFVLLGCLNSMTVQAQTVDWNEVGLKNSLCSPYPVSDPQVSCTLPLSPLPLSPFAWANCGGKVKGRGEGANTGVMNPPHRRGMTDPANGVAALRTCEPWIGLFHMDLACRLGGMLWWWL